MKVARTRAELAEAIASLPRPLGLVPTMGALHAGHLALVAAARAACEAVFATIFVNPTQFSPTEDLAAYPRDEADDLRQLDAANCDAVWLPSVAAIYPPGDATTIDPAGPALDWEGAQRPGHFRGVATVVAKLFGLVQPDAAFFGEKDWQQLQVVNRMAADLALPVRVVGVPTVREPDGLAMSSRNRFLTPQQRQAASLLHAALKAAAASLRDGSPVRTATAAAAERLATQGFTVDYLALVDGPTLQRTASLPGSRLIVAARLGRVRLLDNLAP